MEDEDEQSLKGIEDCKQPLKQYCCVSHCKGSEDPRQPHNARARTCNAHHFQINADMTFTFNFTSLEAVIGLVDCVNRSAKYTYIEENDQSNRSENEVIKTWSMNNTTVIKNNKK